MRYDSERQRFTGKEERARIARVVEELGQLNDRRMEAQGNRDRTALLLVASAYADRGMTETASRIRFAAQEGGL
jgi:hypothetical protein